MKISAVIIAGNEEQNIGDAIRSVDWADEVLVIDSESTDLTREIAEELGARVIVRPWPGFSRQKQFGVDQAAHDRVLSLDADERISPQLKEEILRIKNGEQQAADGYRAPRLAYYMGRPVRHCGWYPDWQLRLFDRRKGRWKDVLVHESVEMATDATVRKLAHDIIHLAFENPTEHKEMIDARYAPLAAEQMFESGRRTSKLRVATAGPIASIHTYFVKLGFLDGAAGYHISRLAGYHARRKHELLWALQAGGN